MADGRIDEKEHAQIDKDIKDMAQVQQYAVSNLAKFGITNPYRDDRKQPSAEYWAWFRWWDAYIKGLSEKEWRALEAKMSAKEDVSLYRPTGDWKENVAKEEENIKKGKNYGQR